MASQHDAPLVLVTGASGYLGTAVTTDLARDHRVVAMDVKEPDTVPPDVAFIAVDLTDDDSVRASLATLRERFGPAVASCIHMAAYYDFSGEPSPLYRTLTVEGTRRLLGALQDFELEQFVFASTHIVMKPVEDDDEVITEDSPIDPAWDYPKSKLATERLIARQRGDVPAVILRLAGVYDEDTRVVPIAQQIRRIYERQLESYVFPGDATHGQAFVHLADTVDCIRRVIARRGRLDAYEVFMVAEPEVMSYDELQEQIGELVHGQAWPTIRIPKPVAKAGAWVQQHLGSDDEAFIKPWMIELADDHYPIAIDHARQTLGWEARHRLRTTLPRMIGRLLEHPDRWYRINGFTVPASTTSS